MKSLNDDGGCSGGILSPMDPFTLHAQRVARALGQETSDLPRMDRDYLLWREDWQAISQVRPELASQFLEVTSGSQRKSNFEVCLKELSELELYTQPQSVLTILDYVSERQGDVRPHLSLAVETAI